MAGRPVRQFLQSLDHDRIAGAIREAESRSTGEIRVHVANRRVSFVREEAERTFAALGMTRTRRRNGVLLFVAPRVRGFAVIGDAGIHERCGDALWERIAEAVRVHFRAGRFTEGILEAVERAGAALAEHFPRPPGERDTDELPNQVSED